MGRVVDLKGRDHEAESPETLDLVERFRRFWKRKMDPDVREGIRAIVNGVEPSTLEAQAREVLEFLNTKRRELCPGKAGYQPGHHNLKHIRARLAEGVSPEQLRAIVAVKCRQVLSDDYEAMWLRPSTLFNGEKCAAYLAELGDG